MQPNAVRLPASIKSLRMSNPFEWRYPFKLHPFTPKLQCNIKPSDQRRLKAAAGSTIARSQASVTAATAKNAKAKDASTGDLPANAA
jgi:hypothetical protein